MKTARILSVAQALCAILALGSAIVVAQQPERIGAPSAAIADTLRKAVEEKGHRVSLEKGGTAQFWFTKNLSTTKQDIAGALYPELSDGEFVGLVEFTQPFTDFRGQGVPAGAYTLRYQRLPQDGNHLGVAPNPDFLLAILASADLHPEESYPYKKLIALSAKSTGGNHPAVIALENAGEPGTITRADNEIVFSVAVPSGAGTVKLGICLTCSASQ